MAMKMTAKELLHAKELEALGIPLDGEVLEKVLDAYRGLWIGQDPISIHTELFDLASGGTGISIGLTVWNESSRIIRLKAAGLEIWWCNQIRWLEDPFRNAPRKFFYSFPKPDTHTFERDAVLNHQIGRKHELLPGNRLDRFLLGIGEEPIPDHYREGELFEAPMSIYDGRNNAYPLDLKFRISRDQKNRQRLMAHKETFAARRAGRSSILSEPEHAESCIREAVTQSR
jgi:hypothetical protein